ncbi:MAG: arginine N-succinyltransferase [Candidatus Pelagadaptatus aseana]
MSKKIELSMNSFNGEILDGSDYFLLVMEDTTIEKVVGAAGVYAKTGNRQAFYAYRLMSLTHYSHSISKEVRSELLHLTNDYTDCSEVGTFFLDPDYRGNGHWLGKSRYLLMGQFKERFAPYVIAELRGWVDKNGKSPFWEAIGRQFFEMDFDQADHLCGIGSNQFITELMPKHPIYTSLLPESARQAMGKPNQAGVRAFDLLIDEGFEYEKVIDIFDGGPLLKGRVDQLRSVRRIDQGLAQIATDKIASRATLVATSQLKNFRVVHTPIARNGNGDIKLSSQALEALNCNVGSLLRFTQH